MATVYTKEEFKEIEVKSNEYAGYLEGGNLVCVITEEDYSTYQLMYDAAQKQLEEMNNALMSMSQEYCQAMEDEFGDALVEAEEEFINALTRKERI